MTTTSQSKDDDLIILSDDIATDENIFGENVLDEGIISDDSKVNDDDILTFDSDLQESHTGDDGTSDSDSIIDLNDNENLEVQSNVENEKSDDSTLDFDFGDLGSDEEDKIEESEIFIEEKKADDSLNETDSTDSFDLGVDLMESTELKEDILGKGSEEGEMIISEPESEGDFSLGGGGLLENSSVDDTASMSSILDDTIAKLSLRKDILEEKKSSEEFHISTLKDQVKDLEGQISESEEKVKDFQLESKHIESNISQLGTMKDSPAE